MKIGVMTAFSGMLEHYSLTTVVQDQVEMIHHGGHDPIFFGLEDFSWPDKPQWLEVRPIMPFYHKIDYRSQKELSDEHKSVVVKAGNAILSNAQDLSAIFTHDLMFTGWNLPLAIGVHQAAEQLNIPWFHWVHSVPGKRQDWWSLPKRSKLVYPNHTDRIRCAEAYGTWSESVLVIPHTKDPRQFRFSTDLAKHIVTEYDVLGADIIQTFPVAIDRIEHKGFDQVLAIFGYLKRLGKTVKLIVCNSWCNVDQYRDKVRNYQEMAAGHGLLTNTSEKSCELIWTSLVDNSFHELGVSQKVVSDLMSVSNLYIYPTKSESFGLTVAEAAQSGQLLVLNASLAMMREVAGEGNALYFHFGSHSQQAHNTNWEGYYHDIARIIAHRMENNEGLRAKTEFQRKYRREAIWRRIESAVVSEIFAIKREKGPVTAAVA